MLSSKEADTGGDELSGSRGEWRSAVGLIEFTESLSAHRRRRPPPHSTPPCTAHYSLVHHRSTYHRCPLHIQNHVDLLLLIFQRLSTAPFLSSSLI